LPAKLALSVAFPAAVYLLYWKCARRDLPLNFALLLFAFGAGYAVFLVEAQRTTHGNFLWGAYVTLFILYLFSATFLVRQLKTTSWKGAQRVRHIAAIALLLAHVASGIFTYVATLHQKLS
jgi:peptidoglycan/LPS O-acetylase OafA/YrhL